MTSPNAWQDPWIPVVGKLGVERVSLRELFMRAHELLHFGPGLTPLDQEALLRFLPAVGATILRTVTNPMGAFDEGTGQYPPAAIEAFESSFDLSIFDLRGDRPFMQRWDRKQTDLDALVVGNKTIEQLRGFKPLEQLHPHEPGGSSAKWAVRREDRDPREAAALILLLVTTWFQTKNGNGKDPFDAKVLKGSTGTWHVNPMALFAVHESNLALTLMANTPARWLDEESPAAFFDHDAIPSDFAMDPESLFRCTYATTLPLVCWEEDKPIGFVLGADATIPIPLLGANQKESLGRVHADDHTRMYLSAKDGARIPRGSFGTRLSTAEGFNRWFAGEQPIQDAVNRWRLVERLVDSDRLREGCWRIGILSETTDGKGTRTWCDWSDLPLAVAGGDPQAYLAFANLVSLANKARSLTYRGMQIATSTKKPESADAAQAALMGALEGQLIEAIEALAGDGQVSLEPFASYLVLLAVGSFGASTDPFLTPQNVANVSRARAMFGGALRKELRTVYPADIDAIS